jgi:hypothetical protein
VSNPKADLMHWTLVRGNSQTKAVEMLTRDDQPYTSRVVAREDLKIFTDDRKARDDFRSVN